MKRQIFLNLVSLVFIVLFVYAALSKLLDYEKFLLQLYQSPLINSIAGFVAWFIPATEIVISMLLASLRFKLLGLYASFCLMTIFSAYIFILTRFSKSVPCSCGGILEKLNWNQHLVFNMVFTILAFLSIVSFRPINYHQPAIQ